MTIIKSDAGLARPVEKLVSILSYMEASAVTSAIIESLKTEEDLTTVTGLISAGAISTDGISTSGSESGSGEETILEDWQYNELDRFSGSETASEDETLSFTVLQTLTPATIRLAYKNVSEDSTIEGREKPDDKLFVVEYLIKGKKVREIFPLCAFSSRGERTLSNEALDSLSVTYAIRNGEHGDYYKVVF